MRRTCSWLPIIASALALACSKPSPAPSAPSAADAAIVDANADGSLLKASTPTPQSPIGGARLAQGQPVTLVITNSTLLYAVPAPLSYRFELMTTAGAVVEAAVVAEGSGTTSRTMTAQLNGEQTYQWRARPEYQGIAGPWSAVQSFVAPPNDGYIRGAELYDPLNNGKTVGEIHGPVTFIPGVGIRLDSQESYVSYQLGGTLNGGELSVLISNIGMATGGLKTKVFSMAEGYDDITTNRRRFTIEKRGTTEPGHIAWRVISNTEAIETIGNERRQVNFTPSLTYFWRATWATPAGFRLTIDEGGVGGQRVYDFSREYEGEYDPVPHVVHLGSPPTRIGAESQTVPGIVLRQLWVSRNPRPSFANQ
jgi:hypothetical protein